LNEFNFEMAQINKLLLLLTLIPFCLSAQIGLILEDETKTGFKLVIDGYLQNEQSLNKLNLLKLEAGTHDLILIMNDGEDLRRRIDLKQSDNYHFVVHQNFTGQRKLRFRGAYVKLSQNALTLDYNNTTEYQDQSKMVAVLDSLPHYKTRPEAEALKAPAETVVTLDSSIIVSTNDIIKTSKDTGLMQVLPIDLSAKSVDSVSIAQTGESAIKNQPNTLAPFNTLQKSIQLNSFEFDKIQMIEEFLMAEKISSTQLETLLKELKYDQSRLQVLEIALSKQGDLKEAKASILANLDYELSRQKAETYFQ
jgi:hypothetical protein